MKNGDIDSTCVGQYLEYTKTINRYFSKYIKGSVLLYDKEYREQQHELQFQWGTPQRQLAEFQPLTKPNKVTTQILSGSSSTPSVNTRGASTSQRRNKVRGPYTPEGKDICRKFNAGMCDFPNCRLAHVCSACFLDHSATSHTTGTLVSKQ